MNATEHSKYIPPPENGPDRGSIYDVESVEFYSVSNRYTVRSDLEVPDTRIEFNQSEISSEADHDRPHQKLDDSNQDPSGSKRTNIEQLCTYKSAAWASEVIQYKAENASHELTIVSNISNPTMCPNNIKNLILTSAAILC